MTFHESKKEILNAPLTAEQLLPWQREILNKRGGFEPGGVIMQWPRPFGKKPICASIMQTTPKVKNANLVVFDEYEHIIVHRGDDNA